MTLRRLLDTLQGSGYTDMITIYQPPNMGYVARGNIHDVARNNKPVRCVYVDVANSGLSITLEEDKNG